MMQQKDIQPEIIDGFNESRQRTPLTLGGPNDESIYLPHKNYTQSSKLSNNNLDAMQGIGND